MLTNWIIFVVTINTVASQLLLKRVVGGIDRPFSYTAWHEFLLAVASSPLVYVSLLLQAFGYVLWMIVLSREKLGTAVAISGAFFYLLVASLSWLVFGEKLSTIQCLGIGLITAGVVCLSLQRG